MSFTALVGDVDVPSDWLTVVWESDIDGVLDTTAPDADGVVAFVSDALTIATHAISLTVTDEVGATCSAAILHTVGTPPMLSVTSPASGDVVNETAAVSFAATVSDNEDPATDIALSWSSDVDGEFSTQGADAVGSIAFDTAALSAGDHSVTVRATDTDGLYAQTTQDLTINQVPTAPTVSISPDPAYTVDTLTASASGSRDPDDSGPVTHAYAWSVDGVASSVSAAATFPSSATQKGSTYRVVVTPSDGTGTGPTGEASLTVQNTAPVLSGPTLSAAVVQVGDTLTCSGSATDVDAVDTPTVAYAWSDGSTGATYTVTSADTVGGSITCTATADDGDGGTDTASAEATVANTDPVMGTVSVSPTTGQVGDVLTCSAAATDVDGGTPTVDYSWSDGSTGAAYTIAASDDPGDAITCTATATDADGGSDSGTASATVTNTPPVVGAVTISPATGRVGDVLTCTGAATDADGDAPALAYAWSDGSAGPTYTVVDTDNPGDVLVCTVTATDPDGGADSDTASATVENTDPVMGTVSVSPSTGQ
ncbi:MAG: Ig-like domain-containing protein, partial [Myxococcota bacterium]|nr:Ig-like domain-containing protein [Myxococcota bacterium]